MAWRFECNFSPAPEANLYIHGPKTARFTIYRPAVRAGF
jgi:hypothetical protein